MSQDFRLYSSAEVWDQEMQLGQKNLLRALIDFWPPDVSSALDVGCGDGKLTKVLAVETGIEIVGFDSSVEALSRLSLPAIQGDASDMPFENASFDLVFSTDTLEHVPDDTHDDVWAELFRVARNHVLIAVPFREELLDATAKCSECSKNYHVNWHQRSYDVADLHHRAPLGWHVQATVISGERWPDLLPAETRLRRTIFGEWSGWRKAVCPHCGAAGHDPSPNIQLPSLTAAALGQQIYASLAERRVWRSHSEIMAIFGRTPKFPAPRLSKPMRRGRLSTLVEPAIQRHHKHLVAYPQVARCVNAVDAGIIIQFPIYGHVESLRVIRKPGTHDPVHFKLEDGFGALYSGLGLPTDQTEITISLPRIPVPGVYGVLLQTESQDSIASVQLGTGPEVSWLSPEDGKNVSYHHFGDGQTGLFVQITDETWLDESLLAPATNAPLPSISDLLVHIEMLSADQRAISRRELQSRAEEADRLAVVVQNLEAERDALQKRAQDADQLAVTVQNLEAERNALRSRAEEADRLAVVVQNLEAERDALQVRAQDADQLAVTVQNLEAERNALRSRAEEADRLTVALQNLEAKRDALQVRAQDADQALARIQNRPEYKVGDVVRRALSKKKLTQGS